MTRKYTRTKLGSVVKTQRIKNSYTQAQLAKLVNALNISEIKINQSDISDLEQGKRIPSGKVKAICNCLSIDSRLGSGRKPNKTKEKLEVLDLRNVTDYTNVSCIYKTTNGNAVETTKTTLLKRIFRRLI